MKLHNGIFAGLVIISLSACVTRTVYVSQPPPPDQQVYTPAPQQQVVAPPPQPYQQQQQVAPPPQPYQQQQQAPPVIGYQQTAPVGYDQFYNELAPYGQWVNYGSYGYVWIPYAGANFTPYSTAGHWEYTDYGWMWVSEYQWGWAPFHYGRWEFDAFYGWFWIPGNEWAPAWVSWRNCNGYYGWAPLGYGCGWDCNNIAEVRFIFVDARYIDDPYVYNHYESRDRDHDYYNRSNFINRNHYDQDNRVTYNNGPEPAEVSRYTGTIVSPVQIHPAAKPGQTYNSNGGIELYRPTVTPPRSNAPQPTPRNVVDIKQVQPVQQRTVMTQPTVTPHPRSTMPANNNTTQPIQQPQQQQRTVVPQQTQQQTQPVQQQRTEPQQTQPVQPQQRTVVPQQTQQQTQPVQQQRTEPQQTQPMPQQQQRTMPQQQQTQPVQQQRTEPQQQTQPQQQQRATQPSPSKQAKQVKPVKQQTKPVEPVKAEEKK